MKWWKFLLDENVPLGQMEIEAPVMRVVGLLPSYKGKWSLEPVVKIFIPTSSLGCLVSLGMCRTSVHSSLICKIRPNSILLVVLVVLLWLLYPYYIQILKEIPHVEKACCSNRFCVVWYRNKRGWPAFGNWLAQERIFIILSDHLCFPLKMPWC